MFDVCYDKLIIFFGGGLLDVMQLSLKFIWCELSWVIQYNFIEVLNYDELVGCCELWEQIVCLMFDGGLVVIVDDLVFISGCYSVLLLVLLLVCQSGDIIVVEFFCYYGIMQMLCGLGLKMIEIFIDLEIGISIEVLELVLDQWLIKGVIFVLNCNNLLGFIMLDVCKCVVLNFV